MAKRDDDLEFSVNAAFDEARAVVDRVPLYLVNGSLGAGKTSVLEFLLQQSDYKGARVIENEYANENVDGYRLEGLAEMVTTLAGDCVCCSSKHALTRMLLDFCRNSPALPKSQTTTSRSRRNVRKSAHPTPASTAPKTKKSEMGDANARDVS
jgi:hypothetical protein